MTSRQHHELIAPIVEERICGHKERIGSVCDERREGRVDLVFRRGSQVQQLQSGCATRGLHIFQLALVVLPSGVDQYSERGGPGMSSRSRASRLVPSKELNNITPVALPPGRLRLATSPALITSSPLTKTIGTARVAAFAASTEGRPPVTVITAT